MFKHKVSPMIFLASVICFCFPFVTVSCGSQKVVSFSGVQLMTGVSVYDRKSAEGPTSADFRPDPAAIAAAACGVAGVLLGFLSIRMALAKMIIGGVGAGSLLLLKYRVDSQVMAQGRGILRADYEVGFYLALLFLVGASIWNGYLLGQRSKVQAMATETVRD